MVSYCCVLLAIPRLRGLAHRYQLRSLLREGVEASMTGNTSLALSLFNGLVASSSFCLVVYFDLKYYITLGSVFRRPATAANRAVRAAAAGGSGKIAEAGGAG